MAEPQEINRAIKGGLDTLMTGDSPETFMQPIQTAEDLISRGLMDENGNATSKGVLFTDLQDAGAIDGEGKLTEKGWAYSMPKEKTLEPDNLWAFKVRENDGVDDSSNTFGELSGAVGDFVWDAAAGLGRQAGLMALSAVPMTDSQTDDLHRQRLLSATAISEGAIKGTSELWGMAGIASGAIGLGLGKMIDMDEQADGLMWQARQELARTQFKNQNAAIGKTLEDVGVLSDSIELAAKVKESMPSEEFSQIAKQGEAFGQFLDPTVLIPATAAAKAGKVAVTTRAAIKADQVLAKTALLDRKIATNGVELAAAQRAAATTKNAAELSAKMADEIGMRFEQTGDQLLAQRANMAREIAARNTVALSASADEAARLAAETEQLATVRNSLAVRIPKHVATATKQAIEVGAKAKAIPANVFAAVADKVGAGLSYADNGLKSVADKFGIKAAENILRSGVGVAGFAVGGIPGLATAAGVLGSGPLLRSMSKFSKIVGNEMVKARGQIPFWQRVANYSDISPVHRGLAHLMDTATLGGAVPGAIRRSARGAAAAYPIDLMFEMLADGGNPNADTFKRAAAESLVIGGSSAMLGGMFQGTKSRHRDLAVGDEINFRADIQDPTQKALFDGMKSGTRRAMATYAASNPQLQIRLTETGTSGHSGNVATINIRDNNPIKPLIAHEVMHHVVIRNQMEDGVTALLVGDGESGGLLRSNDGTLDPNFQKFWDTYNGRMKRDGLAPVDINTAALEYYIDSSADYVSDIAESGELGAISGRTEARRLISKIVEGTISKTPIIKDIHFKLGGLQDMEGRMVMGNGLLSDGLRELPQVKAMTRQMLKQSSGRSQGQFDPSGKGKGDDGGAVIPVQKGDKPVLDKLISIFETEEVNGQTRVKYDKSGDPIMISPATDMARSKIGLVVGEALQDLKQQGKTMKPGELDVAPDGTWEGSFLGDGVIKAIEDRGILNKEQIRILKNVNAAIRHFDGSRFSVINHPATKKVGKKVRYATLAPTLRDVVPVAIIPTKDGNLTVGLMSATQLNSNIESRTNSKRGKSLYQGNREQVMNDVSAVMELHRQNQRTDAYFDEKYGPAKSKEYKNFINTIFGVMTPEMKDINPLFEADKIGYKENVYKTYRLDRISQATRMTGATHLPMPFVYDSVKLNLMPNGEPTLDINGMPVVQKSLATPDEDYRMQHRPMTVEGGAARLNDLTPAFGDDIYGPNALQYFGAEDPREREIVRILKSVRGNPDAIVTIYRGVPEGVTAEISPGDWVTLSKKVAEDYGKVVSKKVKASDVTAWADSLMENGYDPSK